MVSFDKSDDLSDGSAEGSGEDASATSEDSDKGNHKEPSQPEKKGVQFAETTKKGNNSLELLRMKQNLQNARTKRPSVLKRSNTNEMTGRKRGSIAPAGALAPISGSVNESCDLSSSLNESTDLEEQRDHQRRNTHARRETLTVARLLSEGGCTFEGVVHELQLRDRDFDDTFAGITGRNVFVDIFDVDSTDAKVFSGVHSKFISKVVLVVMISSVWSFFFGPLLAAFTNGSWREISTFAGQTLLIVDCCVDVFFMIYLFLCLFTSFIDKTSKVEVQSLHRILWHHLFGFTWWIELLSCFPTLALMICKEETAAPWIWFQLLKALRAHRFFFLPDAFQVHLDQRPVWKLVQVAVIFPFLATHLLACVWCLVSGHHSFSRRHPEKYWAHLQMGAAPKTSVSGGLDLYLVCWIEAVYMTMSLGIHDPTARDMEQSLGRARNSIAMAITGIMGIVATIITAIILSNVVLSVHQLYHLDIHHHEATVAITEALRTFRVPASLRNRVHSFHNYCFINRNRKAKDALFQTISSSTTIETEMTLYMFHELILNSPIFDGAASQYVLEVVKALDEITYVPGDYIIRMDEVGREIFFMMMGVASVILKSRLVVAALMKGDYFGEIALLTEQKRQAWVRADSYCVVASLSKELLDPVLEQYPQERMMLERRIHEMQEQREEQARAQKEKEQQEKAVNSKDTGGWSVMTKVKSFSPLALTKSKDPTASASDNPWSSKSTCSSATSSASTNSSMQSSCDSDDSAEASRSHFPVGKLLSTRSVKSPVASAALGSKSPVASGGFSKTSSSGSTKASGALGSVRKMLSVKKGSVSAVTITGINVNGRGSTASRGSTRVEALEGGLTLRHRSSMQSRQSMLSRSSIGSFVGRNSSNGNSNRLSQWSDHPNSGAGNCNQRDSVKSGRSTVMSGRGSLLSIDERGSMMDMEMSVDLASFECMSTNFSIYNGRDSVISDADDEEPTSGPSNGTALSSPSSPSPETTPENNDPASRITHTFTKIPTEDIPDAPQNNTVSPRPPNHSDDQPSSESNKGNCRTDECAMMIDVQSLRSDLDKLRSVMGTRIEDASKVIVELANSAELMHKRILEKRKRAPQEKHVAAPNEGTA